jgi:hypothetical protein
MFAKYRKSLGVLLVTVLTAISAALTDGITDQETVVIIGLGLSSFGTGIVPNLPTGVGAYAKAIVTLLLGSFAVLAVAITGGLTGAEVIEIVLAGFAAVGITVAPRNIGDYRDRALNGRR